MINDRTAMGEQVPFPNRHGVERLLIRIVRHAGSWVSVLLATSLMLAAAQTVLPAVLGDAVDAALNGDDFTVWLVACGLLIGVLLVCDVLDDLAAGMTTARSTAWLRRTVLDHILALGTRTTRRFDAGDLPPGWLAMPRMPGESELLRSGPSPPSFPPWEESSPWRSSTRGCAWFFWLALRCCWRWCGAACGTPPC
jgi:hypothetical protein